jgi:stage II sporulation protein AB (anti-sigma F factor)
VVINNQIKLTFMSVPENVALARVTVAAFASQLDFNLEDLEEVKVAVSEAVSNCILHGYENDPNRTVSIVCTVYGDYLEIVVEDEGKGIVDVAEAMQPAFTTDPERMGLGFTFMQSFMDNVEVQSSVDKGTKVVMHKRQNDVAATASEEN